MPIICTRCEGTGFINLHQIPKAEFGKLKDALIEKIPKWMINNPDSDVSVCDCCGDGYEWYGVPGEHYNQDDQPGRLGVYWYNGGLCECH